MASPFKYHARKKESKRPTLVALRKAWTVFDRANKGFDRFTINSREKLKKVLDKVYKVLPLVAFLALIGYIGVVTGITLEVVLPKSRLKNSLHNWEDHIVWTDVGRYKDRLTMYKDKRKLEVMLVEVPDPQTVKEGWVRVVLVEDGKVKLYKRGEKFSIPPYAFYFTDETLSFTEKGENKAGKVEIQPSVPLYMHIKNGEMAAIIARWKPAELIVAWGRAVTAPSLVALQTFTWHDFEVEVKDASHKSKFTQNIPYAEIEVRNNKSSDIVGLFLRQGSKALLDFGLPYEKKVPKVPRWIMYRNAPHRR